MQPGNVWQRLGARAAFELAYITWRASRGEPFHFSTDTLFGGVMYALMGVGAVALTCCAGVLGLSVGLMLGCVPGTLTGAYVSAQTGHAVGGLPGNGAALPVLHWSLVFGDLRVSHFVGLHAMQTIPLVAWLVAHLRSPSAALHALHAFAACQVALTVFTFAQALRGQPI